MLHHISRKKQKTFITCLALLLTACRHQPITSDSKSLPENSTVQNENTTADSKKNSTCNTYKVLSFQFQGQVKELCHHGHLTLFNPQTHLAYYSEEYLTPAEMNGHLARKSEFLPDPLLSGKDAIETSLYSHSGYDRGHLAPSADFKGNNDDMSDSYLLSNIAPQNPTLNRESWAALEKMTRSCARRSPLWVATGIHLPSTPQYIKGIIPIPDAFWKVISDGKNYRIYVYPNQAVENTANIAKKYEMTQVDFEQFTQLKTNLQNQKNQICKGIFP